MPALLLIVQDGRLMAAIETAPEEWSNRLRVTELWVDEGLRRQGLGHALMELAREQTRRENRRALILETTAPSADKSVYAPFYLFSMLPLCMQALLLSKQYVQTICTDTLPAARLFSVPSSPASPWNARRTALQ